jgi:hypothetical protein
MTVMLFVLGAAFITCIVSIAGKCPLWVPVLLLCIAGLLQIFPLR